MLEKCLVNYHNYNIIILISILAIAYILYFQTTKRGKVFICYTYIANIATTNKSLVT